MLIIYFFMIHKMLFSFDRPNLWSVTETPPHCAILSVFVPPKTSAGHNIVAQPVSQCDRYASLLTFFHCTM